MLMKSYYVTNVEDAMEAANRELGGDALLVATRRTAPENSHLGRYEVVFARDWEERDNEAASAPPAPAQSIAAPVDSVREQLQRIRLSLAAAAEPARLDSGIRKLRTQIEATGIGPQLAGEIAQEVTQAGSLPENWRAAVHDWLAVKLPQLAGVAPTHRKVTVLIGPPGRGKTTTLMKLLRHSVPDARISQRVLALDIGRMPASDQLRKHSLLLGIPFQSVRSVSALGRILTDGFAGTTLIDTAAFSAPENTDASEFAQVLGQTGSAEVHLVLRADSTIASHQESMSRYAAFTPHSLIFTGLDEIAASGSIADASISSGLPVAFVSTGARIPEDLKKGTPGELAAMIMGLERRARQAAA